MKRWWIAVLAMMLAYAVMRYGVQGMERIAAVVIASGILLCGFWLALGRKSRGILSGAQRVMAAMGTLACVSVLSLFFLHAPAALDDVSYLVIEAMSGPGKQEKKLLTDQMRQNNQRAGNWLWNEQTIRPLPRRANLKPGNQPEVFLQLDDPAEARKLLARRAYVSAFALGTYGDASWTLTPPTGMEIKQFPERPGTILRYEIFHPSDPSGQTPLVALQGMLDAEIAPLNYRGDGVTILPPSDGIIGYRYRARSKPLSINDLTESAAAATDGGVRSAWLQLPKEENLVIGIRGLIAENVRKGSLKQQLLQLRNALREECRYSLDIANPDNRDPLENFLFHEKRGHCELFATAGVMAARAMGVPSRIAYGWAGGSYYDSSNLFVFRAREAHAWTEVMIADVGWVVMDCTPEASIGQSRSAPPGETPITTEEQAAYEEEPTYVDVDTRLVTIVISSIGLGAAGIALFLALTRRKSYGLSPALPSSAPAAGYYRAFLQFCARCQIAAKKHHTLRQLLRKFPDRPAFAVALQRYHYTIKYGKNEPDPATEKELQRQIENQK